MREKKTGTHHIEDVSNESPVNLKTMPKSIKVSYAKYKIEPTPKGRISKEKRQRKRSSWLGECHTEKSLIKVWKYQSPEELANTLLHEVGHAILWSQGVHLSESQEEKIVYAYTNGLCGLIRDNPELIRWLLKSLK